MPPRRKSLRASRPYPQRVAKSSAPNAKRITTSTSAKRGRTVIRTFHALQKNHASAMRAGDELKARDLEKQMQELGGLEAYQSASLNGQKGDRGGDSSAVLVQWLKENMTRKSTPKQPRANHTNQSSLRKIRVLEIGSLFPNNAISKMAGVEMTRIDLNSQHPLIEKQDFMQRPLPITNETRFDVVSCSLVLNYVPDAAGRGNMLRRTCQFLKQLSSCCDQRQLEKHQTDDNTFSPLVEPAHFQGKDLVVHTSRLHNFTTPHFGVTPCLFLVLPAPCVTNSRYLDEDHLGKIMESLGYQRVQWKISTKLMYSLWHWKGLSTLTNTVFRKQQISAGHSKNNFAVALSCDNS